MKSKTAYLAVGCCLVMAMASGVGAISAQDSGRNVSAEAAKPATSTADAPAAVAPKRGAESQLAADIGPLNLYSCPPNCTLNQSSIVGTPAGCEPAGPPACSSATYSCNCAGGVKKDLKQTL